MPGSARKHGVLLVGGIAYEFWWAGEKVELEDFNRRVRDQMAAVLQDISPLKEGMELGEAFAGAAKLTTEIDTVEKILQAPICDACRLIIENGRP